MNRTRSRREFIKNTGATLGLAAAIRPGAGAMQGSADKLARKKREESATLPSSVSWSRRIPVRYEADIAVVGGGMAGVSAACAAAKLGAKVILVERFAVTGGMLTTGGVANFCGQLHGQGEVFGEILSGLKSFHALGEGNKESVFHYEILAIVLQEMLLRCNVKLLLHTRFVDVLLRNGRISECIVCGKSGPEALRATQFIDCTGDGDVARAAGFETMKGRPEDGLSLPMSMIFFVRHVKPEQMRPHLPEGWFKAIRTREELPMTSPWPDGPASNALKIKVPMFDATTTESMTAAEIRARRRMMEVLDYYQRVEKKPWRLDHCSPTIGIREGCRIVGDYVLKVEDVRAGRSFEDGVARGTYYLDAHKPDDDKRTYILPENQRKVPPYQIPLRSLIAKDGKNLMMAGRCFSADQLALSSARVSTTCSMMGQAVGTTAALCIRQRCDPRDINPHVVRRSLEERGAQLAVA